MAQKKRIWKHIKLDWGNGDNKKQCYKPFPAAEEIHKSKARTVILACGNRFAKSLIASMEAVAHATQPGVLIWIVGANYKICDPEMNYIENAFFKTDLKYYMWEKIKKMLVKEHKKAGKTEDEIEELIAKDKVDNYMRAYHSSPRHIRIDWPGEKESVIETKSYTADWMTMEGFAVDTIIYAEGSKVPSRLRERHLKKRLSDHYGREWIPCTPKGRDTFLYPAYMKGLSKELVVDIDWNNKKISTIYKNIKKSEYHVEEAESYSESYETFQYPGYENPYYNKDDYDSDVRELFNGKLDSTIFKERNFGTFESLSGSYFMGVDESVAFVDSYPLPNNVTCYRAMDPGRATHACCLWIAVQPIGNGQNRYIIYNELYMGGLYLEKFCQMVRQQTKREIYCSYADRETDFKKFDNQRTMRERMVEQGIYPLKTPGGMPTGTIQRCEKWLPHIKDGNLIIFKDKCPNTMEEILGCEYKDPITKNGVEVRHEKLAETPQHAIDAINYFFWCPNSYVDPQIVSQSLKRKEERIVQPMSMDHALSQINKEPEGMLSLLRT